MEAGHRIDVGSPAKLDFLRTRQCDASLAKWWESSSLAKVMVGFRRGLPAVAGTLRRRVAWRGELEV